MALTKEMIWKAADELDADGTKPTLANVRKRLGGCLLYTSPSPRDVEESRMPSSA